MIVTLALSLISTTSFCNDSNYVAVSDHGSFSPLPCPCMSLAEECRRVGPWGAATSRRRRRQQTVALVSASPSTPLKPTKPSSAANSTAHTDTPASSKVKVEPRSKDHKANLTSINVVMTHAICDFDSLASAVGLAKVWSHMVRVLSCPHHRQEGKWMTVMCYDVTLYRTQPD